jgi:hypothetical protein
VAALAFGRAAQLGALLPVASACAVLQVTVLRARLRFARRPDGVAAGAIAGAAAALVLAAAAMACVTELGRHPVVTALVAGYIGAPVGAFLSYFRADDARIEAAARARGRAVDYGRDAHWLDPFAYGAAAYLAVFVPRALWSGVGAAIVGAMVGVVAAGVSHFFLARLRNAPITIPMAALAGAPLGAITGLLLRGAGRAPLPAPATGALAGMVCFAITAAVGHRLARRERAGVA